MHPPQMTANEVANVAKDSFWEKVSKETTPLILQWWFTDTQFLFPPSQIALSGLLYVLKRYDVDTEVYVSYVLDTVPEDAPSSHNIVAQLLEIENVALQDMQQRKLDAYEIQVCMAHIPRFFFVFGGKLFYQIYLE